MDDSRGTVAKGSRDTCSADTLIIVRPVAEQGSLALQLQLLSPPTTPGGKKRMRPLYSLHCPAHSHRAHVRDAERDSRVAEFLRKSINIPHLVHLDLLQGESAISAAPKSSPPPSAEPSAQLDLEDSAAPKAVSLLGRMKRFTFRSSTSPSKALEASTAPAKTADDGGSRRPDRTKPSGEYCQQPIKRREGYIFDVGGDGGKRRPTERTIRFEWRQEARPGVDSPPSASNNSAISLPMAQTPSAGSNGERLSVPQMPRRTSCTDLHSRPVLSPTSSSFSHRSESSTSSLDSDQSRSRSSSTASNVPLPAGKWSLYLTGSTPYGYKDLFHLVTITPTTSHPLLVAHLSVPRLPPGMPDDLPLSSEEVEECMSVLCLWLMVKERKKGGEAGGWWRKRE